MTINIPACFSVTKGGTPAGDQTGIVSGSPTLITFGTVVYNIGGFWGTPTANAWTPPAGFIEMSMTIQCTGTITAGGGNVIYLYKNGAALAGLSKQSFTNQTNCSGGFADWANGADYYQFYFLASTTSGTLTASGATTLTQFCGHWICP